jgi:hypothetical protein
MLRRIALLALLTACGSDDDEKPAPDAGQGGPGNDASVQPQDAGSDAQAAKPNQVTNAGAACRTANTCMGEAPSCQTMLSLLGQQIPFPGGYCSAACKNNIECGPTAECPVGESLKTLTASPLIPAEFRGTIEAAAPSHCYERCTMDSQCRVAEGYRCTSIVTALTEGAGQAGLNVGGFNVSLFLSGPIVDSKYCLPPPPVLPDAGLPDAGPSDAGADAALTDAGSDAALSDAGSDAAANDAASDAQADGG